MTNLQNAALFRKVTESIHEIMTRIEAEVLSEPKAWWLARFVGVLHATKATIITFNYDTLLECATSAVIDYEANCRVMSFNLLDGVPPVAYQAGAFFASAEADTFRLLKLHGSLDTYWVPGDISGATISRLSGIEQWISPEPPERLAARRHRLVPGRSPFVVPPASAKSSFYNNPVSRELWRAASQRLHKADCVAVVGYSIPPTDLVTNGMLGDTLAEGNAHVVVVNPSATVVQRIADIGVSRSRIQYISSCADYVNHLEAAVCQSVAQRLGQREPAELPEFVCIAQALGSVRVVNKLTYAAEDRTIRLSVTEPFPPDPITYAGTKVAFSDLHQYLREPNVNVVIGYGDCEARMVDFYYHPSVINTPAWLVLVPSAAPSLDLSRFGC